MFPSLSVSWVWESFVSLNHSEAVVDRSFTWPMPNTQISSEYNYQIVSSESNYQIDNYLEFNYQIEFKLRIRLNQFLFNYQTFFKYQIEQRSEFSRRYIMKKIILIFITALWTCYSKNEPINFLMIIIFVRTNSI